MENLNNNKKKGATKHIVVSFVRGLVINEPKPTDTYLKTLQEIGLQKIAKLEDFIVDGLPLVVKKKDTRKQLRCVDNNWYVSTHMCTAAKKRTIERIAAKLKVRLSVELTD